jgi:hypothetical protein
MSRRGREPDGKRRTPRKAKRVSYPRRRDHTRGGDDVKDNRYIGAWQRGFRFWRSLDFRSRARDSGDGVPTPGTLGSLFRTPKLRARPGKSELVVRARPPNLSGRAPERIDRITSWRRRSVCRLPPSRECSTMRRCSRVCDSDISDSKHVPIRRGRGLA